MWLRDLTRYYSIIVTVSNQRVLKLQVEKIFTELLVEYVHYLCYCDTDLLKWL